MRRHLVSTPNKHVMKNHSKLRSVSLTWALIELALHPEAQDKLRAELSNFVNTDPSYDELHNSMPYINAVTREVIRLHPPVEETAREVRASHEKENPNKPIFLPTTYRLLVMTSYL